MKRHEGRIDGAGLAYLVRYAFTLDANVEGCEMSASQKAQSPLAGGQSADQNTNTANSTPAEKIGNLQVKRLANLRALFALKGHAVHDGGNGDYIIVQANWGMSRHCQDFSALVAFGRQLGVINHG